MIRPLSRAAALALLLVLAACESAVPPAPVAAVTAAAARCEIPAGLTPAPAYTPPADEIVRDVGSGINWKRPGLIAILDRAMRGDVQEVVVSHRDRLCRFAFDLVKHVLERAGCRIVVQHAGVDGSTPGTECELRDDLLSIGASQQSISPIGVERYEDAAFLIAGQVMTDPALRARVLPCEAAEPDCAATFAATFGRLAWRRDLTTTEVERLEAIAAAVDRVGLD